MAQLTKNGCSAVKLISPNGLNLLPAIKRMAHGAMRCIHGPFSFARGGIRRRLMIWGLSLFGVALGLVVAASYFYTVRQIEQDAAELQREIASVTAERIRNFVQRKIERFSDTAHALNLYPLGSKEQQVLLSLLTKNDNSFTDVSIIAADGMEVLKVSDRRVYFPSDLTDQSQSEKFNKVVKGERYIGPVHTSEQFQPYITIAIPLWGDNQSVIGVAVAEADLSFLWEVIARIDFGSAGYGYLVDERGNLIAHKDAALVLKRMNLGEVAKVSAFLRNRSRSDINPARKGRGLTGEPVLATFAPVPDLGWAVILEEPIEASLANVEKLKRYAVVLLVFGLIVGAAVIVWVSSKMTGPILELRQGVAKIGAGDLEHRTRITTGDEIQDLADEFNKMTDALQNLYDTLEQKVGQRTKEISALYGVTTAVNQSLALQDILDAVIAKITEIFHFESTRIFLFNDEMDELELRASFEVDADHKTGVRMFRRGQGIIGQVAETGKPMIFEDIRTDSRYAQLSRTKATHNAKLSFFAVFPIKTQSHVFGVILFNARSPRKLTRDETRLLISMSEHVAVAFEKANLFRQSELRSRELSVVNQELQEANRAKSEFIAAMSHELRTPLNVIMGNAELTGDGFFGAVSAEQKKSMTQIRHHSQFLLKLVNDVLALSRLDAKKMSLEASVVNIEEVVAHAQSQIQQLNRNNRLEVLWDVEPNLPDIVTDVTKLEEILQNLIGNAFKFTPRGQIRLRIRNMPDAGRIEFSVADTGIGIEPRDMARIFSAFEQIKEAHTGDFNGVGLGLNIVKKYLELMHGDIRVESEPGEGSTFIFSVPHSIPVSA